MAELTDEQHFENRRILHNLLEEVPQDVAKIIKLYDYDEEGKAIHKNMLKISKPEIQNAADFLLQVQPDDKTKPGLVAAIINRIDSLLLEKCNKCDSFYSIGREDTPSINCQSCGQGAHEPCYKDLARIISSYPGVIFLCARCENTESKTATSKQQPQDEIQDLLTQLTPTDDKQDDASQPSKQENPDDNEPPICQLYKRGACPHGITGLRKVNDRICNFSHPKRCMKYCQFAEDPETGCSDGRDCDYFHPILCKFALKDKLCTNRSCRFTHIRGTKRFRPRTEDREKQVNPGATNRQNRHSFTSFNPTNNIETKSQAWERNEGQYPPAKVWENQAPHSPKPNPPMRPQINQEQVQNGIHLAFLEEMKTQMRDMQKEIREMKEAYRPQPIPFLPNPMIHHLLQNPHSQQPLPVNHQNQKVNMPHAPQQIQSASQNQIHPHPAHILQLQESNQKPQQHPFQPQV